MTGASRPGASKVVPLGRAQWADTAATLAAAFHDDPVFGWLLPGESNRRAALRRFFAIEARHIVLRYGHSVAVLDGAAPVGAETDSAGTLGVALVLPPGHWRTPLRVQAAHAPGYLRAFRLRTLHALGVLTALERRHLRRPHYYLPYVGVVPAAQGRGHGAALLAPMLQRCDREGLPAYLEASNPRCTHLYERLGFTAVEDVRPLGAPALRLMVREPAS